MTASFQTPPAQVLRSGLAAILLASAAPAAAEDNAALVLLKSMSDYMAAQTTLRIGFDSDVEVITPALEKIQFASSGELILERPSSLKVRRTGGYADVELVFDGTAATLTDLTGKTFARIAAEGTIDDLRKLTHEQGGLTLPGADLLSADAFGLLSADVTEAKHIGQGVINGTTCEHLAFRTPEVDWQLWVATGDAPRPCRMIVTSKTIALAPEYTLTVTRFEAGITPPAGTFAPTPGTAEVDPGALAGLDEIPPPAPAN